MVHYIQWNYTHLHYKFYMIRFKRYTKIVSTNELSDKTSESRNGNIYATNTYAHNDSNFFGYQTSIC